MHEWLRDLFRLALPPLCCSCARDVAPGSALCRSCRARLGAVPVGPPPAGVDGCSAAVVYQGEAALWIHRFKYPRGGLAGLDPAAQGVLHALVREAATAHAAARAELVVPVPLHAHRLRARGFSPAAMLARSVAHELGLPCVPTAAERTRETASQTGLGRRARQRNVAGAFRVGPAHVDGKRICLVDDVVTTGNTLAEVARALRRAGAEEVQAVCVARTPFVDDPPGQAPGCRVQARSRGDLRMPSGVPGDRRSRESTASCSVGPSPSRSSRGSPDTDAPDPRAS